MKRILEPEVMDTIEEAKAYDTMDFLEVNTAFVDRLIDLGVADGHFLDLGTGSGNIAVALAVNIPGARITAVDISPQALEVAERNASLNGVEDRIEFIPGDLFSALPGGTPPFDLIVSNPPYIAGAEEEGLMDDVRLFEPRIAFIDSRSPQSDGLGFFRDILDGLDGWLGEKGSVIVEVGNRQGEAVEKLFSEKGLQEVSITRDYAKIYRIVRGRYG